MATPFNPFTDEHEAFRKSVRSWVEKELTPHALEWDKEGIFPREVFKKAGELGFLGINHDPASGGSGLDYWYVTIFAEELDDPPSNGDQPPFQREVIGLANDG